MITIKQPGVSTGEGKSRLSADIDVDGDVRKVWFEVDAEYGSYLCFERSDAFLIGLLYWAMLAKHDIVCEAPVSAELLFQIRTYLIPSLPQHSSVLYPSKITAAGDPAPLPNAGAVGTGISCGVDSFHALAAHADSPYPHLKLTHLALNNVGSHGAGEKGKQAFEEHRAHVKAFCREYGFKLVVSDSNFGDVFPQNFLVTHTYSSGFAIYALQKFWRYYFYASSGCDINGFSLTNSEYFSSSRYELLLLPVLSTSSLRIYSEGATLKRLEKLREVAEYEPAHRYLNVCGRFPSCCKCRKCKRTLLELYAIGSLEKFRGSFDVDYFYAHRDWYLIRFLSKYWQHDSYYVDMYPLLKDKITAKVWVLALFRCGIHAMLKNIKNRRLARAKKR